MKVIPVPGDYAIAAVDAALWDLEARLLGCPLAHSPGMAITAGEYGCDPWYFRRMLAAEAVDVLQVDATRALGITGVLRVDALCPAHDIPLSLHTAPALHRHLGAALDSLIHAEWFIDHVRIEQALFDGAPEAHDGCMDIDPELVGNGLSLRREEAARHAI